MNLLPARFLPTLASFVFVGALGVAGCTATATIGPNNGNGSCAQDDTVNTCEGSAGWSCTGSDAPQDTNPSLNCSDPVEGNAGSTLYCCVTSTDSSYTTCHDDDTVKCTSSYSFGFTCSDATEPPTEAFPALNCSSPVEGSGGSTTYCCTYGSGSGSGSGSTCAADTTVTGCQDSNGYSCTGSDTPDQSDSTLLCSDGTAGNAGSTLYCCVSSSTPDNSCQADNQLNCPSAGSFGFTCTTPTDKPTDVYPSLNCSAGIPAGSSETYCCTDTSN